MALETATYVSQLVPSNPLSTDSVAQADDHLRLIKSALVATFPNLTGPVTTTQQGLNYPVPQYSIILWSGVLATVPPGWAICDGTQGTPDLRDNFVIGAGRTYAAQALGGSTSTGPAGTHTHTANNGNAVLVPTTLAVAAGVGASPVASESDSGHSHTINEVGDHTHANLPPFVALYYIMKL